MKAEYDFSKGQRGRFHRRGATLSPPVHLEPDVLKALSDQVLQTGESMNDLVNRLLKRSLKPEKV